MDLTVQIIPQTLYFNFFSHSIDLLPSSSRIANFSYTGVVLDSSIPSEQESSSLPRWKLNEFPTLSGTIDCKRFITQIDQNSIAVVIGLGSLKSTDIWLDEQNPLFISQSQYKCQSIAVKPPLIRNGWHSVLFYRTCRLPRNPFVSVYWSSFSQWHTEHEHAVLMTS